MKARIPTCHPDRKHEAHGLCERCYTRARGPRRAKQMYDYCRKCKAAGTLKPRVMTADVRNRRMLSSARARAKIRGIEFSITAEDIVAPVFCPVLGLKLDPTTTTHEGNLPTLDRVDPTRGYIPGNVWVISWRANRIKVDSSLEELRALVAALEERERREFRRKSHLQLTRAA